MEALAKEVLGFAIVKLMIAGDDGDNRIALDVDEGERLARAVLGELEELRHLLDGRESGSVNLLQGAVAGTLSNCDLGGSGLVVRSVTASVAVHERGLTGVGKSHELDGGVATDLTGIGHDGQCLETAALADVRIGLLHIVIGLLQGLLRGVEGVAVLHDELATAHEAKAGAHLVAELVLNLVQVHGKLLVALELVLDEVGDSLLMGGAENELALMTVGDTHELGAVHVVATGLAPHLGIDHDGHEQLLGAGGVHLIADDILDLAQRTPCEGQVAVKTRRLLADHTRTQHEAVARELGLRGVLLERGGIQIGHLHRSGLRHSDLLISIASNASIIPANAPKSCLAVE
ncbi:Uncharacterised protein [Collinsella intestinalis]|nr:Uncharacterised protein [Collinsella intestinalis]